MANTTGPSNRNASAKSTKSQKSALPPPSELSAITNATVQGVLMAATSNILAQALTIYRSNARSLSTFNLTQMLHFVILAVLTTPINYVWQKRIEEAFPAASSSGAGGGKSKTADGQEGKKMGREEVVRNTAVKLLLDQSFGAAANTFLFIAIMALLRGAGVSGVVKGLSTASIPFSILLSIPHSALSSFLRCASAT